MSVLRRQLVPDDSRNGVISQQQTARIVASLGVGGFLVASFIALGVICPKATPATDSLMKPGELVATFVFGGLHGLEPLVLAFGVDALLFSCLIYLLWWVISAIKNRTS